MPIALAAGFSTSIVEIVIFFIILVLSVALWVGTSLRRHKLEAQKREEWAQERFDRLVASRGLGATHRELLERMAGTMRNPRDKYQLLEDQRVFNQAARTVLHEHPEDIPEHELVSQPQIASLRMHLGFTGSPTGKTPRATAELPEGAEILLAQKRTKPVPATVLGHQASSFRVKVKTENHRLSAGHPVQIIYRNEAGIFRFDSTVFSHQGEMVELNHSERGHRVQRRDHYRRAITLPVTITPLNDPEQTIASEFIELGGNGATLKNPDSTFAAGDELELTFSAHDGQRITVIASVIRTSSDDARLHVRFINIREYERDEVYRLLFNYAH